MDDDDLVPRESASRPVHLVADALTLTDSSFRSRMAMWRSQSNRTYARKSGLLKNLSLLMLQISSIHPPGRVPRECWMGRGARLGARRTSYLLSVARKIE